ncbi:alpha/beta fold hydrolase [Paraferrimonas sp. SM1919]|uniref:alpha/beta fold hydrolase n=1 Tax=Paraferrimonas sp. SM1919 TaxID=2662263 RepID=UPI0013D35332|nr:alpha/beta hydrolase [Paraferrimonas sp. SM1919]
MDITEAFEEYGTGPTIVFIHGSFATTSTWKRMVAQLSQSHHCICIKLPGHGGLADPTDFDKPTVETELRLIEQIIAAKTTGPIQLVGHSYGGVVALALALKGTVTITQMTLFEPVCTWVFNAVDDQLMHNHVEHFVKEYKHAAANDKPDVCGDVIDFWGGTNSYAPLPDFVKEIMNKGVNNNLRHWQICSNSQYCQNDLNRLMTPTQLVCGSGSNQVAKAIVKHLRQQLPISQLDIIEGASHFLVTSHADQCLEIMKHSLPMLESA